MGRIWDDMLTPQDRLVVEATGGGRREGFGRRPAVVIVDMSYNFCGPRPEPLLESVRRLRTSCGAAAWEATGRVGELLAAARARRLPIVYSTMVRKEEAPPLSRWGGKNRRAEAEAGILGERDQQILVPIAPLPGDIVIRKQWPSAFFATPLMSYLTMLGVDSIIVCGGATSGCVRSTVLDAFSYNLLVTVVEDCTFDRIEASHKMSLFDMNLKYADVVPLAEVLSYLQGLSPAAD